MEATEYAVIRKVSDIHPYECNPRDNTESVDKVANSIKEFGFLQPIVCDKDGSILAGHTRYAAAQKLGLEEVPVVYASKLTDEQARAYRLADNKVGEKSKWDDGLLIQELSTIRDGNFGFNMTDFGFKPFDDLRLRSSWKKTEKLCGLERNPTLREKNGYMYTCFYKTGKNGKPIEEIKQDRNNVQPFADNLCDYISKSIGNNLSTGGFCICTTPKRRHKDGFHFATEICRTASRYLHLPFYEDALTADNRRRIDTSFHLDYNPKEPNVILYDDIITTGVTIRDSRKILMDAGHNVVVLVGIRNS